MITVAQALQTSSELSHIQDHQDEVLMAKFTESLKKFRHLACDLDFDDFLKRQNIVNKNQKCTSDLCLFKVNREWKVSANGTSTQEIEDLKKKLFFQGYKVTEVPANEPGDNCTIKVHVG